MSKFNPDTHIIGKPYDMTQNNMQKMLNYIDDLELALKIQGGIMTKLNEIIESGVEVSGYIDMDGNYKISNGKHTYHQIKGVLINIGPIEKENKGEE